MKLNYKKTFFVGASFMAICAFWQLYDNIVPLILTNTFEMGETLRGVIMALDNVLALFLLPILGTLSDKYNSRLGKRTPFIILGTALSVIFMMLMPIADNTRNYVLFLVVLGGALVSMALYRSPAVALMPDVTPKPLRSSANAVINLMGALGGVMTLVIIMIFSNAKEGEKQDYTMHFLSVAILMIACVVLLVCTVRENKEREAAQALDAASGNNEEKPEESNENKGKRLPKPVLISLIFLLLSVAFWYMAYNAVTTAFSTYVGKVWGLNGGDYASCLMVATVAAVISYIPVGIISSKIGRKKVILAGVVAMFAAYLCGAFATQYQAWINIIFALVGIGWAAINVNSYPMVVEMASGADVGKYTGLYYTFSMAAQILTPVLSGALLEHFSYRTLFPYAAAFSAIAFVTMLFVRHGDNKPTKISTDFEGVSR